MREIESFIKDRLISKNLWPPRSPDLTFADFFLWGPIKGQSVQKIHPAQSNNSETQYAKRFKPSTCLHLGESIPEFGETHSSVLGCKRRPVSASVMSRSCFPSFPVCVYKFSSHYLNTRIFYRQ